MSGPKIPNLEQLIAQIPQHSAALPPAADRPIEHYKRGANDAWNLLRYFERNVQRTRVHAAAFDRHATTLRNMVLIGLIESFERYLKEVAALCIDHVAPLVLDDRLTTFRMNLRGIAANFSEKSLGKALCEADTWLDTGEINARFGKVLAEPFASASFQFFPQSSAPDGWRKNTMDTLFQLRHTIVHNVSVITRSDAARLRILTKCAIDAPRALSPVGADIRWVKAFLDETTTWANHRVANRLAELLTTLYANDAAAFDPKLKSSEVAQQLKETVIVAGVTSQPS